MIIIKNRKMIIPTDERYIGTDYDSNSEVMTFRIDRYTQNEIDLAGFTAKADIFHHDTGSYDRADLTMEVHDDFILLYLYVTAGMTANAGTRLIDIKMFNTDGVVKWSSYKGAFVVEGTIDISQQNLTELEQLEIRINEAYDRAVAATNNANSAASTVGSVVTNCQNASIEAREAASDAAAIAADLSARIASGEFNGETGPQGPQGPQGESGISALTTGFFTLWVDDDGNLYCDYSDEGAAPSFTYNAVNGNLYFNF